MHSSRCSCVYLSPHRKFLYVRNDPVNRIDPDGRDYNDFDIYPWPDISVKVTAQFFYYPIWDIQMILTALFPKPTITTINPTQGSGDSVSNLGQPQFKDFGEDQQWLVDQIADAWSNITAAIQKDPTG